MILVPAGLVLVQPDLGTALVLALGGAAVMFAAGVSLIYFGIVFGLGVGAVALVFASRGKSWQLLHDYQFRRIDTFLDPASDPLGAGYHITQAKIALGSGGWGGRGFMQGTQSRLNFLPEKHTDFIFTTLAEEFGFVGAASLLGLFTLILLFCLSSALGNRDRFAALLTLGGGFYVFSLFRRQYVNGDGPGPRGGRAAALGFLWGVCDACCDGGVWLGAKRACASAPIITKERPPDDPDLFCSNPQAMAALPRYFGPSLRPAGARCHNNPKRARPSGSRLHHL